MEAYLDDGRVKHPLQGAITVIGRDRRCCNLVFDDELLSRKHCYVVKQPNERWAVLDMNSSNGVHVNGAAIEYHSLEDGDRVEIGSLRLTFHAASTAMPASSPKAASDSSSDSGTGRGRTTSQEFVKVLREKTVVMPSAQKKEDRSDFDKLLILYKVSRLVTSETDLDTLLSHVVDLAMDVLDADRVSIMFRTRDGLVPKLQRSRDREQIESGLLHISQSISEFCLQRNEPTITQDALVDHRFQKSGSIQMYNIRSAMCSPLTNKDEAFGVLYVDNRIHGDCFDEDDLRLLEAFADSVAIAIVNSRLITELRKSLGRVKQQQEALIQGEKLAAMGQLSAGISHEIRGPLAAISGYVQMFFAKFDSSAPFFERMKRIEESLDAINGIVSGLLDLARKGEGQMGTCDVIHTIESTLKIAEHSLRKTGSIQIERQLPEGLPAVFGNPRQLQQVFLNMMLNAAQAMPQGGTLTLAVRAGPALEDGRASVEVLFRDTGVGIAPDDVDNLFQPFFTKGKKGGTGLGLSISKNIVDLHSGKILVDSKVGGGTTFLIRLPCMNQASGQVSSGLDRDTPSTGQSSGEFGATWREVSNPEVEIPDSSNPEIDLTRGREEPLGRVRSSGVMIPNLTGKDESGGSDG